MDEIRETTEHLPCKLTDDEVAAEARRLATVTTELFDKEEAKKAAASGYADEIKQLKANQKVHADHVRTRTAWRFVECVEMYNGDSRMVELIRRDTGEIVTKRPATDADRQLALEGARPE